MKKLIALAFLAVFGFYVAWPAWSGYRIYSALERQDAGLLASKIDFDSLRTTLRPSVAAEVEREADRAAGGIPGPLRAQLKSEILPKVVDATLTQLVTPDNVLRIYREGGDAAGTVRKILAEQMGGLGGGLPGLGGGGGGGPGLGQVVQGLGGLGGLGSLAGRFGGRGDEPPAQQPSAPVQTASTGSAPAKPSYGLGNIKGFGLSGPLGWKLGLAKDPAAAKPDLTAGMSFRGFDWKLTHLELNR
ncbi:MAG: hypothetical protein RL291_1998 [Pseudomonadota bacterium]